MWFPLFFIIKICNQYEGLITLCLYIFALLRNILFIIHIYFIVLFQFFYHFYFNFLIFLIIYFGSREKNLNALLFLPKKPLGKEGKEVDKEWKKF
jgi:hypothetical protein